MRKEILQVGSNNPFIPFCSSQIVSKKEGIQSEWKKRKKNYAKNNFFSLLKEAKNAICNYSNIGSTLKFFIINNFHFVFYCAVLNKFSAIIIKFIFRIKN